MIVSSLNPLLIGWTSAAIRELAIGTAASLTVAGISGGWDMYVKKTGYYKMNTDNNGYPYYVHDIVEVYRKTSSGSLKYLYNEENFYYAYQYPQY